MTELATLPLVELVTPALSELAQLDQWVISKLVDGQKPPFSPHTRRKCSHSNPEHWASYQTARSALRGFSWLGFVFSEYDPYSGVDLDGCRDKDTGIIEPWAGRIIDMCGSYTEISPSETGVKIWVRGTLPEELVHSLGAHKGIEVYSEKRYFTFTGRHLAGTPAEIRDAQYALDLLWAEYHKERAPAAPRTPRQSPGERAVATSAPAIPDVLTILLADGAIQTSPKDLTCPYCDHTHKNTLFIFKGRVYSRSPGCIIPQKGGLDTVGLHAVRDYGSNTDANRIAVLKARYPIQPRQRSQEAPQHATVYRTPEMDADAERKRAERRAAAEATLAEIQTRASADATLSDRAQLVLLALLETAGTRDWTRASVARLAELTELCERYVHEGLRELERGAYISSGRRNGSTTFRTFVRLQDYVKRADEYIYIACEGGANPPACESVYPPTLPDWQLAKVDALGALDDAAFAAWYAGSTSHNFTPVRAPAGETPQNSTPKPEPCSQGETGLTGQNGTPKKDIVLNTEAPEQSALPAGFELRCSGPFWYAYDGERSTKPSSDASAVIAAAWLLVEWQENGSLSGIPENTLQHQGARISASSSQGSAIVQIGHLKSSEGEYGTQPRNQSPRAGNASHRRRAAIRRRTNWRAIRDGEALARRCVRRSARYHRAARPSAIRLFAAKWTQKETALTDLTPEKADSADNNDYTKIGADYVAPVELPSGPYSGITKHTQDTEARYSLVWESMRPLPDAGQLDQAEQLPLSAGLTLCKLQTVTDRPRAIDLYLVELAGMSASELAGELRKHRATLKKHSGAAWLSGIRDRLKLVEAEIDARDMAGVPIAPRSQARGRRPAPSAMAQEVFYGIA